MASPGTNAKFVCSLDVCIFTCKNVCQLFYPNVYKHLLVLKLDSLVCSLKQMANQMGKDIQYPRAQLGLLPSKIKEAFPFF